MVAERPDDIPAAMREAFADRRIASAWNMMAVSEDGNRMAALGGFERLLKARGLTLEDIATAMLAPAATPAAKKPTSFEEAFGGFGDMFGQMADAARRTAATTAAQAKARVRREHIQGKDVPAQIHGTIEIVDERPSRTGTMLVFEVVEQMGDVRRVYGPIAAFSDASIAKLRKAADKSDPTTVSMKVRAPVHPNHMPSAQAVWFA